MGLRTYTNKMAVLTACLGILAAPLQAASPRSNAHNLIPDIALQAGGVIEGAVVNPNGHRISGSTVKVTSRGELKAQVRTDKTGRFRVENLRGGIYQFQTDNGVSTVRVWAAQTAPPSAARQLLIVDQGEVVRGIFGEGHGSQIMNALSNPLVLAGIVAVAIAVPLALDDNDTSN
jgi:hypothetical protein